MDISAPHFHVVSLATQRIRLVMRLILICVIVVAFGFMITSIWPFGVWSGIIFGEALAAIALLRLRLNPLKLNRRLSIGIQSLHAGHLDAAASTFEEVAQRSTAAPRFQLLESFQVAALLGLIGVLSERGEWDRARVLVDRLTTGQWHRARRGRRVACGVALSAAYLATLEGDSRGAHTWFSHAERADAGFATQSVLPRYLLAILDADRELVGRLAASSEQAWTGSTYGDGQKATLALVVAYAEQELGNAAAAAHWQSRIDKSHLAARIEFKMGLFARTDWPELRAFAERVIRDSAPTN
jgi:hypothetical protein